MSEPSKTPKPALRLSVALTTIAGRARTLLDRVAGEDRTGAAEPPTSPIPTLAEACEEFLAANPRRKRSTEATYRSQMRYCLGDWLPRRLDAITRRDVEARFHRVSERHGWAVGNQAIALLRAVYRRPCVDHERLRNPVELWLAGGGRYHRPVRRRISTPAEVLPRWREGIEAAVRTPATRDIFWFGMFTGMRRGEILALRWECVDLEGGVLRVEETKTGEPLELPVTRQLAAIFGRRRDAGLRDGSPGGLGVSVKDQRVRPHRGAAASLPAHQPGGRDEVLVPRAAERLHHGRRARPRAAAVGHETPRQPRPARRRYRKLRCRLDRPAVTGTRAADRGPDRGARRERRGGRRGHLRRARRQPVANGRTTSARLRRAVPV